MADLLLDTCGLNCPLPILKTKQSMRAIPLGGSIEVLATDPASDRDFRAFCRNTGHPLLEASVAEGVYRFVIQRAK